MVYLFVAFWVLCGIAATGMRIANEQYRYPLVARDLYWFDVIFSTVLCTLSGPLSFIFGPLFCGGLVFFRHWRLTPPYFLYERVEELTSEPPIPSIHFISRTVEKEFDLGPYTK